jgi:hypothetical protein
MYFWGLMELRVEHHTSRDLNNLMPQSPFSNNESTSANTDPHVRMHFQIMRRRLIGDNTGRSPDVGEEMPTDDQFNL